MYENQDITADEFAAIRMMDDLDLTMLISEINDHGRAAGRVLIAEQLKAELRNTPAVS